MKPLTVIIRPTDGCNLGCIYCVADLLNPKGKMSEETLRNIILKSADYNARNGRTKLIWHGREPLVAGVDYFRIAVDIQKSTNHEFINTMQTNGTLLDEQYLNFFREHRFRLGFSLDGMRETHDANRTYKDGQGSFDIVFDQMKLAKQYGIGGSGAVCVVNKNTIDRLTDIYEFFKKNSLHLQLNPQIQAGRALERPDLAVSPLEFGRAMIHLFDLWFFDQSQPVIEIEPFSTYIKKTSVYRSLVSSVETNEAVLSIAKDIDPNISRLQLAIDGKCDLAGDCFNAFVAVDTDGTVYTCNRWIDAEGMQLGNINQQTFAEIFLHNQNNPMALRARDGVEECRPCEYYQLCNGGCGFIASITTGSPLKKDGMCEAYKMLLSHISNVLNGGV